MCKLVHVGKFFSLYWKLRMYTLFDLITSPIGIYPKAKFGQVQIYIFIIGSVITVKVWKETKCLTSETDGVNCAFVLQWNIGSHFLFVCLFFYEPDVLTSFSRHRSDKAVSVLKSETKGSQETSRHSQDCWLFSTPWFSPPSSLFPFSFLDIVLHKFPRSSCGFQTLLEVKALFSELLSHVVFHCLPGIKVSDTHAFCAFLNLARPVSDIPWIPRIWVIVRKE